MRRSGFAVLGEERQDSEGQHVDAEHKRTPFLQFIFKDGKFNLMEKLTCSLLGLDKSGRAVNADN